MKHLKQFIYLDEYKMYSLSSQLFEGLTEYLLKYGEATKAEEEKQKGPFASGNLWAHVTSDREGQQEKRILHDHTYTLFESELDKLGGLIQCDSSSAEDTIAKIVPGALVRVKGWAQFNDMKAIGDLIKSFNDVGYAMAYLTTHKATGTNDHQTEEIVRAQKDRNRKSRMKAIQKAMSDATTKFAEENNLRLDDKFLESLGKVLSYGYSEDFELQIRPYGKVPGRPFFSSLLKRSFLREEEAFITRKFSRQAPGTFCLLGIVCQCLDQSEPEGSSIPAEPQNMRQAVGTMLSALCDIEQGFLGRWEEEVVLDPVALYREIEIPDEREGTGR
ncbi:MAG: hypothetical protein AB1473_00840 [Thermodesulfobacteriota bacterium]